MQEDFIRYLGWNEKRLATENEYLDILLEDASTYYQEELD